ncbi:hypothetical protein CPLU01_04325 [Colletotrichum plurivorum]|uniref:Uncharacterized protein n=1 Tax=Colletotrichum plurivorum TaxID=2175906 RepID=A0A8H6KPS8_9PEZI|nr:hypothetical protein CPLU01_04325 [Colletotrichum plurivorum]
MQLLTREARTQPSKSGRTPSPAPTGWTAATCQLFVRLLIGDDKTTRSHFLFAFCKLVILGVTTIAAARA